MNREAQVEFRKRQAELALKALTRDLVENILPSAGNVAYLIDKLIQARASQMGSVLRKEMDEMKVQIARYGGNDSD